MNISSWVAVIGVDISLGHREDVSVASDFIPASLAVEKAHLRMES